MVFPVPNAYLDKILTNLYARIELLPFAEMLYNEDTRFIKFKIHTDKNSILFQIRHIKINSETSCILADILKVEPETDTDKTPEELIHTHKELALVVGILQEETRLKYKRVNEIWYQKERWWKPIWK